MNDFQKSPVHFTSALEQLRVEREVRDSFEELTYTIDEALQTAAETRDLIKDLLFKTDNASYAPRCGDRNR